MRLAIYARVSTRDKEQTPDTQLFALRQYTAQRGWCVVGEYVDQASATDLREGQEDTVTARILRGVGGVNKGGHGLMNYPVATGVAKRLMNNWTILPQG